MPRPVGRFRKPRPEPHPLEGRVVQVTREHIMAGRRSSCGRCPVALALQEIAPGSSVRVALDVIKIDDVPFRTPPHAAFFMGWYDDSKRKEDVPPLTFRLETVKTRGAARA